MIYYQISILCILNQILAFFLHSSILFPLLLFLGFHSEYFYIYIFFYFLIFCMGTQKWVTINLTIRFACALNGTKPPVCGVTEPWICRFRLLASDCERRANRSNVTCSIYCVHKSLEMNSSFNSCQTSTSFQPSRPLSLAYLFVFFVCHTKNHATYFHSNKLELRTENYKTKNSIIFYVT